MIQNAQRAPEIIKNYKWALQLANFTKIKKKYSGGGGWSSDTLLKTGARAKTPTYLKTPKPEVEASVSADSRSSWKDERCSITGGYRQKIFSNNLTNIDANTKKNIRIFWGGWVTSKNNDFRDPCFGLNFRSWPKMTDTKPMNQIREAAPI